LPSEGKRNISALAIRCMIQEPGTFADTSISLLISAFYPDVGGRERLLEKKNYTRDVVITVQNISSNASDAAVRGLTQQLLETRWQYLSSSPSPAQYAESTQRKKTTQSQNS